ncbi:alpha-L-fucosidase [Edaphobacter acidisoli]|uniref:alpha-L-fucosidase n=1 Tax=Edaphobacter acidisoli TaxID=2040573 RepID=A0A916RIT5_9BACT|nr:alpha-L-fucosidase [Edaphobacter acidisoli]GGA55474.1 alpha-L-fucosidase [Edaphobacter acidisoli]
MNQKFLIITFAAVATLVSQAQTFQHSDLSANVAHQVAKVRAANSDSTHRNLYRPDWNSLAQYRTPDWFRDAKFGIFIHWGVYSVPAFGNEWYSRNMYVPGNAAFQHQVATYGSQTKFGYKDFIPMFRAQHFDPNAWLDLFTQAGAKYIVPVAEHCDGFPMYNSSMTTWDAARMGPHRDIIAELEAATRAHGLYFGVSSHRAEHWWWYGTGRTFPSDVEDPANAGLYGPAEPMSLPTPDGKPAAKEPDPSHLERWLPPNRAFLDDWLARSTELVDKYHPDFFYFDWWIGQPAFKPYLQQFAAYYYNQSAHRGQHPVLTYKEEAMPANTATLDIERGKLDTLRLLPWQTDTSISIHSWGYVEHDQYRTAKSLIQQLVDTVSKNGNLLLNVGPKSDGTIPEEARTVLLEIGAWLRTNGEAIYSTRPFIVFGEGPTKAGTNSAEKNHDIQTYTAEDIRYTVPKDPSSHILYATALDWPEDHHLLLHILYKGNPYLPKPVCSVELLGAPGTLTFEQLPYGLSVTLPATPPNPDAYVLRIQTCSTR